MTTPIRVLHILDELNTGGAEKIVVEYFKNIDKNLFQWDFVITYDKDKEKGLLEDVVENLGGKIYRVAQKRKNYLKNIKEINDIIKNGKYDVIHSHLDELSTFYLISACRYKVPVRICHSHLAGTDRGKGVEFLCKILKPIMKMVTTNKFACGNYAGETLWGKKSVENGDVHIMHNAIDTKKFCYDEKIRDKKREELGITGKTVIGFVGRLSYQKNPEYTIKIFKEFYEINKNSILLVVGVGNQETELRELVKDYNLTSSVMFLGGRNDINELMMAMDIFLLPSRFEGLPIVLVEAQCTGLTCYISNRITKEIKINDNIYYEDISLSPLTWAQSMQNEENFNRHNGIKNIESAHYKIEEEARNLQEYYIKAINNK